MKVLIMCEESQAICKAFRDKGREAYSNDLQDCSGGHPEWHLQMDCFKAYEIIKPELVIGHPPCQFITNAGIAYFNLEKYGDKAMERWAKRKEASELFMKMWNLPVKKMCLENPVGFINSFMPASQVIHPYMFGDAHKKRTCF